MYDKGVLVAKDGNQVNYDGQRVDGEGYLLNEAGKRVDPHGNLLANDKGDFIVDSQPYLDDDGNAVDSDWGYGTPDEKDEPGVKKKTTKKKKADEPVGAE